MMKVCRIEVRPPGKLSTSTPPRLPYHPGDVCVREEGKTGGDGREQEAGGGGVILRHARSILPPPTSPARGRIPPCVLPLSQCTPSQFLNLLPDIHGAHESQLTEEGRAREGKRDSTLLHLCLLKLSEMKSTTATQFVARRLAGSGGPRRGDLGPPL